MSKGMNIIEFLNKHGILWEPIALNGKVPTVIGGYKPDPSDYKVSKELIIERQKTQSEYIAIFTDKIAHYDIDIKDYEPDKKLKKCPYFKSMSKRLPHYFINITDTIDKTRYTPIAGDILTGQWSYCKRNETVYNADKPIQNFKLADFPKRVHKNKFKTTLDKLINKIDDYSYDEWIDICFAIYNTAYENLYNISPIEYVIKFSEKGKKYDDKARETIKGLTYKQNGKNFATMVMYADDKEMPTSNKEKNKKNLITEECDDEDVNLTNTDNNVVKYEDWKIEWEKHVFSIKSKNLVCHDLYKDYGIIEAPYGSKTYFINDNNFVSINNKKFILKYTKGEPVYASCVEKWNLDDKKREYLEYNFAPYPFQYQDDYPRYNLWKEFKYVNYVPTKELNKEHCIKIYTDFRRHLSKNDDAVYDYLIQIDAHTAQFPGEKIGVALVINGMSGTGKGTETNLQMAIFGKEYVFDTSDISQVLGQFTGSISRKLVVVLDEAVPKNMFDKDGSLKHLITEDRIKIEKKGKDAIYENSFVRLIITSNNDNVVKISNSDRRMFVISPEKYDFVKYEEYPRDIFQLMKDQDACKIVFDYLRTIHVKYRDIRQWQSNRPVTEEYEEMREASIPTIIQFLLIFVRERDPEKLEFEINANGLYDYYKAYTEDNFKNQMSYIGFCRFLRKFKSLNIGKINDSGKKVNVIKINKITFFNEMNGLNYRMNF